MRFFILLLMIFFSVSLLGRRSGGRSGSRGFSSRKSSSLSSSYSGSSSSRSSYSGTKRKGTGYYAPYKKRAGVYVKDDGSDFANMLFMAIGAGVLFIIIYIIKDKSKKHSYYKIIMSKKHGALKDINDTIIKNQEAVNNYDFEKQTHNIEKIFRILSDKQNEQVTNNEISIENFIVIKDGKKLREKLKADLQNEEKFAKELETTNKGNYDYINIMFTIENKYLIEYDKTVEDANIKLFSKLLDLVIAMRTDNKEKIDMIRIVIAQNIDKESIY